MRMQYWVRVTDCDFITTKLIVLCIYVNLPHPAVLKAVESAYEARCLAARIKGEKEPERPGECGHSCFLSDRSRIFY